MSLVKFRVMLLLEKNMSFKVGGPIKVFGSTKKIVSIEKMTIKPFGVEIEGSCEDFRQEPVNQLTMFGVDGL